MIRPALVPTIEALERTIASAGLGPADVKTVVLVGGSSRIPLVGQLLASALGRPISIDVHPKHAVATGAALSAGRAARTDTGAPLPPPPRVEAPPPPSAAPSAPPPAPVHVPPAPEPEAPAEAVPAFLVPSESPPTTAAAPKRRWRDRLPRNRVVRVLLVLVGLWIPARVAVEIVKNARENSSDILKEHPILPAFDVAGAQTALAKVLAAENVYFADHDSYTDHIWWELSDPDFTVPGVTLELAGSVYLDQHIGAVTAYETNGYLFLNALGGGHCLYIRAKTPTDVLTADVPPDHPPSLCPTSYKDVRFSGQEWAVPEPA
jgi:hypothetical protein